MIPYDWHFWNSGYFSEGVSFQFFFFKCFLKAIYKLHHVASIGCTTRLEILKVGFGWMFTSIKNTCRLWWIGPNCPKRKPDHLPVPSISVAFALSFREGIVHVDPPPKKKSCNSLIFIVWCTLENVSMEPTILRISSVGFIFSSTSRENWRKSGVLHGVCIFCGFLQQS